MSTPDTFNANANWKKRAGLAGVMTAAAMALASCDTAATKASRNLSTAADNFEIQREVVFYNGITGQFFATVEGRCSIEVDGADNQLEVTCKHGPDDYRKHFLGLSDNVTYFAMQKEGADVSEYHTRIMFRPQGFIPDIDLQGSVEAVQEAVTPDGEGFTDAPAREEFVEPEGNGYTIEGPN